MSLIKIKGAARAILSTTVPEVKKQQLRELLKSHYKKETFTDNEILVISKIEHKFPVADYKDHGELVVSQLDTIAKLEIFIKRWRQHFITSMQPKYLPKYWSIDHDIHK